MDPCFNFFLLNVALNTLKTEHAISFRFISLMITVDVLVPYVSKDL